MKTTTKRAVHTPKPRIGFWPYDLYPYVTSHLVLSQSTHRDGCPEYRLKGGTVLWSKPLAIMSEAKGREFVDKLKALKVEYDREKAIVAELYASKARAALPFKVPTLEPKV